MGQFNLLGFSITICIQHPLEQKILSFQSQDEHGLREANRQAK